MEVVTKIAPIILALIMLGLGLGLKIEDFTRVLKTPRDFFVGFFFSINNSSVSCLLINNYFKNTA